MLREEVKAAYQDIGLEALRQLSAFEGAPPDMLRFLVTNRARVRSIGAGETLQARGGHGEGLLIIVDGSAKDSTTGHLGPRSVLGEETLFGRRPVADVQASSDITALIISKDDVEAALSKFPGGYRRIAHPLGPPRLFSSSLTRSHCAGASSRLHQHHARHNTDASDRGATGGTKGMNKREFIKSVKMFQSMPNRCGLSFRADSIIACDVLVMQFPLRAM